MLSFRIIVCVNVTLDFQDTFNASRLSPDNLVGFDKTVAASDRKYCMVIIRPLRDGMPVAEKVFDTHCLYVHSSISIEVTVQLVEAGSASHFRKSASVSYKGVVYRCLYSFSWL